tara:strand:+ start:7454 stop:7744 length:291 start_codon:yes stop_codon:yes gene_type:complete
MINDHAWPLLITLPVCFAGGILLGVLYFRAVKVTAGLIVTGGSPVLAIAMTLGRIGLLVAGFALALQVGGLALLAALAGVLSGRGLTVSRMRGVGA